MSPTATANGADRAVRLLGLCQARRGDRPLGLCAPRGRCPGLACAICENYIFVIKNIQRYFPGQIIAVTHTVRSLSRNTLINVDET